MNWLRKCSRNSKEALKLNLSEEEIAFYDALADNESAVEVLGDKILHLMAKELVDTVRKNVTVDWTLRDNVQAKLRVLVKRLLKKYKYPPDMQQKATDTGPSYPQDEASLSGAFRTLTENSLIIFVRFLNGSTAK